jgi:gliding motility-associated-like protein
MRKSLLSIFILLFLAASTNAQPPAPWMQITNGLPGGVLSTATYGSYTVKTQGFGGTTYGIPPSCATPFPILFDLGAGPTTYGFSVTPAVYGIRIYFEGLNNTENIYVNVNGPKYDITAANINSYTGFCPCLPGGPCFIAPGGIPPTGEIFGPIGGVGVSNCNGGNFTITECTKIGTFNINSNGKAGGVNFAVFIDTTKPKRCSNAFNNKPCEGDTLKLGDLGDSTGATYFWTGPHGFISTSQDTFKFPAALTDSGLYTVIKFGGPGILPDTDTTYVHIRPRPYVSLTNNTPLCASPLDTLNIIFVGPSITGETYSWTGPGGFTSATQNLTIYGFTTSDTGLYKVVTTTPEGCTDSATSYASLQLPPAPPLVTGPSPYCFGDPFVPFKVTTVTGATALWYTTTTGGIGSTIPTTINTSIAGITKVYFSQIAGRCESNRDSIPIEVLPKMVKNFTWKVKLGCDNNDSVTFTNNTTNFLFSNWYFWDDNSGSNDTITTEHTFKTRGVKFVTVTSQNSHGCPVTDTGYVNLNHSIAPSFTLSPNIICVAGTPFSMTTMDDSSTTILDNTIIRQPDGWVLGLTGTSAKVDTITNATNITAPSYLAYKYVWDWGDGNVDISNTRTPPLHKYFKGGLYNVELFVTDSIGCVDSTKQLLKVEQLNITSFLDTMLCISQPMPIYTHRHGSETIGLGDSDYTYQWAPANNLDNPSALLPYYFSSVNLITTYTVTVTDKIYGCYGVDTMRIHSVKGVPLTNVTEDVTINYGQSLQLNADSEILYVWRPDNGSLNNPNMNNPVARPLETTKYTVYGYDVNGCLDSAYVNVRVDSTMIEDVPTGFTPNNDGLNDVFRPVGIKFQSTVDFRVYNRLGQQVFYSNNSKNGWDGTFNGQPQDMGTYFYVITVARPGGDGENITYKGTVTLIR